MEGTAYLSSNRRFTTFSHNGINVRFRTSEHLEKYEDVLEWDDGYIVVTAVYDGEKTEEYIDLIPILRNLGIVPGEFLKNIKEVQIHDDSMGHCG